jgi:hypothetical protein
MNAAGKWGDILYIAVPLLLFSGSSPAPVSPVLQITPAFIHFSLLDLTPIIQRAVS